MNLDMKTSLSYLTFILLNTLVNANSDKYLPCRLTWKYVSVGDNVPDNAVPTHTGQEYTVRVLDPEDKLTIGTFSFITREAYFPFDDEDTNSTSSSLTNFEILTNPYECKLSWRQSIGGDVLPPFIVPVLEGSIPRLYVGRGFVPGRGWRSGGASLGTILISTSDGTSVLTEFQVLTSYSDGLRLDADRFQFLAGPFDGQLSSLGTDDIINNSEMEVVKKTRHYKRIVESSSVTTTSSTTSRKTKSSGFDIGLMGASKKVEHTYKETVTETVTTTKVTEVLLEKELVIPPWTSVSACSTVTILDNFSSDFTARGVYSAPGMTVEEVLELLETEGITGPTIVVGDAGLEEVVVELHGNFAGSLSLDSQFIVVPYGESCSGVGRKMFDRKMQNARALRDSGKY